MTPNKKGLLKVEYVPIRSVKPSRSNTRAHPPEQISQIIASIEEFGWTKPIIVDERREILAGHGAYQAALQKGLTEVPIIARHGLTQAQKSAYRTADNKIGENSVWDTKILADELRALQEMGFNMAVVGFKPGEIEALLRPPPSASIEPATPAAKGPTVTRPGDLWQLGEHRLICADSTRADTWEKLMDGRQASLVFTDPPYGVSYQDSRGAFKEIKGDAMRRGQLRELLQSALAAAMPHTVREAAWYIWHASITREDFAGAMRDVGLVEAANGYIIWIKPRVMGWTDYGSAHEPCFYAHQQGIKPHFYGDRSHSNVWQAAARDGEGKPHAAIGNGLIITAEKGTELFIASAPPTGKKVRHEHLPAGQALTLTGPSDSDDVWMVGRDVGHGKEDTIHPTQKPVELARRAVKNSTRETEIVVDFFAGSGSTLIACEQLGRACYAIDLEPGYIDAIIRRWQEATGKTATHAAEQKTYEAIAKARAGKAKAA